MLPDVEIVSAQISQTRVELTMVDGTVVYGEGAQDIIFSDGFETGLTGAWPSVVP